MKVFYKKYNLKKYIAEDVDVDAIIISRLEKYNDSALDDRRVIVVPIKDYCGSNTQIEKDRLLFNPIPLIYSYRFDEKHFPIEDVKEVQEIDISLIENWSFKRYSWITVLEKIPFNSPWKIYLDDRRILSSWDYDRSRCEHLEYCNIVPYSVLSLKLAFEYLRCNEVSLNNNIIDFSSRYEKSAMFRILYNHTMTTTPFKKIPKGKMGHFELKEEEHNKVTDFTGYL
jgi:hypothetical protein